MPVSFTCGVGKPTSPPLSWAGAPPGTKSLALVVDDSSAPITPYVYWIVFNISPQTQDILEGQLPPGAEQARNSAGSIGYLPPCPGSTGHTLPVHRVRPEYATQPAGWRLADVGLAGDRRQRDSRRAGPDHRERYLVGGYARCFLPLGAGLTDRF